MFLSEGTMFAILSQQHLHQRNKSNHQVIKQIKPDQIRPVLLRHRALNHQDHPLLQMDLHKPMLTEK